MPFRDPFSLSIVKDHCVFQTQKKTEGIERFRYDPLGGTRDADSSELRDGHIRRTKAIEI